MIVYLDMDGVLADFDRYMIDVFGVPFNHISKMSEDRWALISDRCQDLYSHLQPMPDAEILVDGVLKLCDSNGYSVGVLTAIPKYGRIPNAEQHKREWLLDRWPNLLYNFNIGPYAIDKQKHARPGHVLIDDSHLNIPQWNAAGGIGILHTSAADSLIKLNAHLETLHGVS
jgi:5'(3')-deoxyribonucleotidase